jgi:hypothetical protein
MLRRVDAGPGNPPGRRELCTIVDRDYLPRLVTLYRSLEGAGEDFRLLVYGAEPGVVGMLDGLRLPRLETVDADELERHDPALAATHAGRSLPEYCYTAKPCICLHALDAHPEIERITYVDADLMCLAPLQPLFDEIGSASSAISPHRFSARWRHAERTHGAFNAGLVSFRRDRDGLAALKWWRERCLDWCYLRVEPDRYTDQVYLEQFPHRFAGVHVIGHEGVNQGPWNAESRRWAGAGGTVHADGTTVLLFHFASLQLVRGAAPTITARIGQRFGHVVPAAGQFRLLPGYAPVVWRAFPGFRLSSTEVELLWSPYLEHLMDATADLLSAAGGHELGVSEQDWREVSRDIVRGSAPAWARKVARAAILRGG